METILELKNKRYKLYDEITKITDKIKELELKDYNYEGKYISIKNYGYMYVTWQRHDISSMFFQGFGFKSNISEYRDGFYFSMDALTEWNINDDTFERYIKNNYIKIISKVEFHNEFINQVSSMLEESNLIIKRCEQNYNEKLKENDQ